ncbi:hypothetical protein LCM4573_23735 [Rhizobium sp. LCM 4573]|nr:hypothetical protein LCM4573_23735 [Rhizobium sp. LCM 4573]
MLPVIEPESMLITEDPLDEFVTDRAIVPKRVIDVKRVAFSIKAPVAAPLIPTPEGAVDGTTMPGPSRLRVKPVTGTTV